MRRTLKCENMVPRWVVLWTVRTTDPEAPEKIARIHLSVTHGLARALPRALSKRGATAVEMAGVEMSNVGKPPRTVQTRAGAGIAGTGYVGPVDSPDI